MNPMNHRQFFGIHFNAGDALDPHSFRGDARVLEFFSYLFIDIFAYVILAAIGHATVFVCSFGQKSCEHDTAIIVGALVSGAFCIVVVLYSMTT